MSKKEKLLNKLLARPVDLTYEELASLLDYLGYVQEKGGKTSGSRRAFIHYEMKHTIRLHKPHPSNIIKPYVIKYVIDELKNKGLL